MACERITAGIVRARAWQAPDQSDGKSAVQPGWPRYSLNLTPQKTDRWQTDARHMPELGDSGQRLGSRVLPRSRIHLRVRAYVKNQNLGLDAIPFDFRMRKYLPDFIVLVDDEHGEEDLCT
ncbi:MAG: hypothetical protein U0X75_17925 [Acidobacteriota bacterium]